MLTVMAIELTNVAHLHHEPSRAMIQGMKPPPDTPEFAQFTRTMRQIMKVSKVELKRRMEADKARKSKPSSSRTQSARRGE